LFTFLFVLLGASQLYASLRQTQYRWRNDDGDETTATWREDMNTPLELNDLSTVLRLRIEYDNDNTLGDFSELTPTLQYSTDAGVNWTTISNDPSNAFVYVSSSFVADGTSTTSQFTGTPGSYVAGKVISSLPAAPWPTLSDGQKTEYEWVIQPTANLIPSATYIFQIPGLEGGFTNIPTLNTNCIGGGEELIVSAVIEGSTCGPGSVELQATPSPASATIRWYDSPTEGTLLGTGTVFNTPIISSTTTYYACAANPCGEGERVPVTATVNVIGDVVDLGEDLSFCESYTLNAGNFMSYVWDDGSTGPMRTVTTSGTYYVSVTNALGCNSSDTINLTANPVPFVDLGEYESICLPPGSFITLDAGNTGSSIVWNDGSTGQTLDVYQTGTYFVTVTNTFGCVGTDTVTKTIRPTPSVNIGPSDTLICNGMTLTLNANSGSDNVSYNWSNGVTDSSITVSTSGMYSVIVTNDVGCSNYDTINVSVNGVLPTIDAILVTNQGPYSFRFETYNLQGEITEYSWDFGDDSPVSHAISPSHTYAAPGNYIVTLTMITANCGPISYETSIHIVGLNDIIIDHTLLHIYPNPAQQLLTIEDKGNLNIEGITVMDSWGRVVENKQTEAAQVQTLDVSAYSNGFYFIRLKTKRGIVTRKIEVLK
jgi:hypothetical protein